MNQCRATTAKGERCTLPANGPEALCWSTMTPRTLRSAAEWPLRPARRKLIRKLGKSSGRYASSSKPCAKGKLYTDYLISTLTDLRADEIAKLYDGRAGLEAGIKGDKRGLGIEKRTKKSFHAQEAVVLLAQLAHNLLAYFKKWLLGGTDAKKLGVERLVREVLAMPAEVRMRSTGTKLFLKVPELHPWAEALARGVGARFPPSGWRTILRKT
jgi:hypothetical protein